MADFLVIDGSHGEGGGQILRTALSLSIITSTAFRLVNIRLGRRKPGLLPQHLSAVRAAAMISDAIVSGDRLGSTELEFSPTHQARCGDYIFDVMAAAEGGSAGSVTLILQSLLVPLACSGGASTVVRGGTHVEWSPSFDHIVSSYLPALRRMGFHVAVELNRWGWYPVGGGEVTCRISPGGKDKAAFRPNAIELLRRGPLRQIAGRAVAANLPAHIPQRMADRARGALIDLGVPINIEARRVAAPCPGAGIFLVAQYESPASFSALGRLGKPSETVADEAVAAFRDHHGSLAAVEIHLADQLLLPLSVAAGRSAFSVARPTGHLATNAWTIGQFGVGDIAIEEGAPTVVRVEPRG